jgi:uncharacterized protein (TIGR03437 family)
MRIALGLAFVSILAASALCEAAQATGTNLLRNPGAEEGPATNDYYEQLNIPGWTVDGRATVYPYAMGDTLTPTSPGPADRGANLFGGGFTATAAISQVVNIAGSAAAIDAGTQKYTLSAWLGGWSTQNDNALLRATFRNASGASVGTAQVGPVLAADRGGITQLLLRSTTGTVPAGTRTVEVVLAFERREGNADDGYADNLSFSLESSGGTGGCTYALSPQSGAVAAAGGTGSVSVTAATGCPWSASFSSTWVSITAGASGSGNGTIQYSAQANPGAARTATLQVQDKTFTLSQAAGAVACNVTLTPSRAIAPAAGVTGLIAITASASTCAWSATPSASWLTLNASSGQGSAILNYVVAANTGAARSVTVTISGQVFTLDQAAGSSADAPSIDSQSVVNLTDGSTAIAPGSLVMIGGARLAPAPAEAPSGGPWPTSLGGVSVEVESGGRAYGAAMITVSPSPLTVQIPYEAVTSPIKIRVRNSAGDSAWVQAPLVARAPRVMVMPGDSPKLAKALHAGGAEVSRGAPARPGEAVQLQVTGLGVTSPPAVTGVGSAEGEKLAVAGVSVSFGGEPAEVLSAVLSSTPGVYVVTFVTPWTATTGDYAVSVTVEGATSQSDVVVPAGEVETLLTQNWNTDACSLTDSAHFQLGANARLTRLTGWYQWEDGEQSVPFHLLSGGELAGGELTRGNCDSYSTNWCEATAKVNVNLASGQDYELRTDRIQLCRNPKSNNNGFVQAWGVLGWEPVTSTTIGSDGGMIEAEGFHLQIPAGNLTQTASVRVSRLPGPVYRVEGFSPLDTRGASLELDLPAEVSTSGKMLAMITAEEEDGRGPMMLPAEIVDGKARILFPNTDLPAETKAAREAGTGRSYLVDPNRITSRIRLMSSYQEEKTDEGHFIIHYPSADANDPYMDQKLVARMLESSYNKLSEVIDTSRRKLPVDVYIFSFSGVEGQVQGFEPGDAGTSETNIWGKSYLGLSLNRDLVADPSQAEQVKVTSGHELFHVFQSLWDPRPWPSDVLHSDWLWFLEASATWFEKKLSSNPSTYTPDNTRNYRTYMLERGLEYIPGSTTIVARTYMRHGYGAASFLEHIYPVGTGEKALGEIVEKMSERSGILAKTWKYSPVEAIYNQTLPTLPLKWRDYLVALLEGKVYPGIDLGQIATPSMEASGPPAINTYTFQTDDDKGPGTDVWKAQDLSAKLYMFEFKNRKTAWKDNTFKLTLEDPGGDAEMLIFKPDGSKGVLLGRNQKEFLVKNLEEFAKAGRTLYVLVANGRAVRPFSGTTEIKFTAGPDMEITKTRWLSAGIHGKMVDAGGGDIMSLQYSDGNSTRPECVLKWSGLNFRETCSTKTTIKTDVTELIEDEFSASGSLASDGKSVKSVECHASNKSTITAIGPDGKPNVMTKEYGVEFALTDVKPFTPSDDINSFQFYRTNNAAASVSGTARSWNIETYAGTVTRLEYKPARVDSVYVIFRIPPAGLFP